MIWTIQEKLNLCSYRINRNLIYFLIDLRETWYVLLLNMPSDLNFYTKTVEWQNYGSRLAPISQWPLALLEPYLGRSGNILSSSEAPWEGTNRQNRTHTTKNAAFISRKNNRSRMRIRSLRLKQNLRLNFYFPAHKERNEANVFE